jgi:hypothetical protein
MSRAERLFVVARDLKPASHLRTTEFSDRETPYLKPHDLRFCSNLKDAVTTNNP